MKLEQILSIEKEPAPKGGKMIAFSAPSKMEQDLALLAVGMGIGKSKLLRIIVGEYLNGKDVLTYVIERVKELRNTPEAQELSIKEFKSKVREFLLERKVPNDVIEKILKSV